VLLPIFVLLASLATGQTPVLISTDCGCEMDDQWAIAFLTLSGAFDVRAVITAHAPGLSPPAAESSAKVARAVLDRLPVQKKPPVIAGSSEPLKDRKTPRKNAGVDRLLTESKGFSRDQRLKVVMLGPATDVASALLIDPTLADRIDVYAMAFDGWPKGGDPFNVRNDVAAWQVVIDSLVPLTVADGEVTRKHLTLTRAEAKSLFAGLGPAGAYLVSIQTGWLDRQPRLAREITGSPDAWPVWDLGPVAALSGFAEVETRSRPRLRDDRTFDHEHPGGKIGWVKSIDGKAVWSRLASSLVPQP
jgi:purine nucleosidase